MKLAEHFNRKEFACRCGCGFDTVDSALLEILIDLRAHYDSPVYINSGCRCLQHNEKVGGVGGSQHTLGRAADIYVNGVAATAVYNYLTMRYPGRFGFADYISFVHVDSRSGDPWRG